MGLFHHHDDGAAATTTAAAAAAATSPSTSTSSSICPAYPSPLYATQPIAGSLTFQRLAEYIGGVAAIIAVVVSISLIFMHAANCTRPAEQTKIMRITAVIPVFALIYFGTIFLGESAVYLSPWANIFEAVAILSLFQLLHAFWQRERRGVAAPLMDYEQSKMAPSPSHEDQMDAEAKMTPAVTRRTRLMVAQYVLVAVAIAIATDVLQALGRFCKGESSPKYGALWMSIIRTISVGAAVVAVLRFNGALKPLIKQYGTMSKIIGFKAIVGLNVIQNLLFNFIGSHYTPSASFAYLDLTVSLAGLISCCEMVIFAFIFHFIYKFSPYSERHSGNTKQMGFFAALVAAFSPLQVVRDAINIGSE